MDPTDAQVLAAAIDQGEEAEILQTTIVHGDFHHANVLVDRDEVTGVLDWEIAGPGDWRFDLVVLAFGCHIAPGSCEPAASSWSPRRFASTAPTTWRRYDGVPGATSGVR